MLPQWQILHRFTENVFISFSSRWAARSTEDWFLISCVWGQVGHVSFAQTRSEITAEMTVEESISSMEKEKMRPFVILAAFRF